MLGAFVARTFASDSRPSTWLPGLMDGENQHSADAIPYQKFCSENPGRSWDELVHYGERRWNVFRLSADGPEGRYRYVMDPADARRVIDMRHFLVFGSLRTGAEPVGAYVEYAQAVGCLFTAARRWCDSALDPEDYYSNALGAEFFAGMPDKAAKTFSGDVCGYLKRRHEAYCPGGVCRSRPPLISKGRQLKLWFRRAFLRDPSKDQTDHWKYIGLDKHPDEYSFRSSGTRMCLPSLDGLSMSCFDMGSPFGVPFPSAPSVGLASGASATETRSLPEAVQPAPVTPLSIRALPVTRTEKRPPVTTQDNHFDIDSVPSSKPDKECRSETVVNHHTCYNLVPVAKTSNDFDQRTGKKLITYETVLEPYDCPYTTTKRVCD